MRTITVLTICLLLTTLLAGCHAGPWPQCPDSGMTVYRIAENHHDLEDSVEALEERGWSDVRVVWVDGMDFVEAHCPEARS